MIDVEAESGTLLPADARQRPVQAVAEPICRQRADHEDHRARPDAGCGKRRSGGEHRDKRECAQVVGMNTGGQRAGDTNQQPFLCIGKNAAVVADVGRTLHGFPSTQECGFRP